MQRLFLILLLTTFVARRGIAADGAETITGEAPISVSAANYRTTKRQDLERAVDLAKPAVNPDPPPLKPLAAPQRYVCLRGEVFESDLSYDQVLAILVPALAKKGFVNAVDAQNRIYDPAGVALVLRVNFGTLLWRLPVVRTEDLLWRDGMVAHRSGRGPRSIGGDLLWDRRGGGNDDALNILEAANADAGAAAAPLVEAEAGSTREFHVIVVDAFSYPELKKEGRLAERLWTTFVAAPRQRKETFSSVAAALARNAIPYFGETTSGLQVYPDARANVKVGPLVEVKDEPKR